MAERAYRSFARAFRRGTLFDAEGRLRVPSRGWAWVHATVPLWAAELARQLREDLQPVPKADIAAPVETLWAQRHLLGPITVDMWEKFIGLVCEGVRAGLRNNLRADTAVTRAAMPRGLLLACLRASPELRARYAAAKRVSRRRRLSTEAIVDILSTVRRTDMSTLQAVLACTPGTALRRPYEAFVMRTMREPGLAAEYLHAKEVQAVSLREALFEETDEAAQTAGSTAALRSAKRQHNKALHRLDQIQPARLRNRQRAIEDPRAADLIARRRRAARARRMRSIAQSKKDRT